MTINVAKVVPWLGIIVVFIFVGLAQSSGSADHVDDYSYSSDYADSTRADAYLDKVAVELAQPGAYVDPAVGLTEREEAELDETAANTAGPVRIAVIPADALREKDPSDPGASYGNQFAYDEDELVGQLYDRVGVDGTYAILVDADSSYDGRSFTAFQWSEERPYYKVEEALDRAVDCCAPDYESMLTTFLEHTDEEQTNPWPILGWVAGGLAALVALIVGGRRYRTRRAKKAEDEQVADMLRPELQAEVVELSATVAALPAAAADVPHSEELATYTRQVLDLVEEARQRLDVEDGSARMDTPSEVEDVVRRLADARYDLVAIDALRRGVAVPPKTAPCFFDPRHGPSVATKPYTPEFGKERPVPVCSKCAAEVDAGRTPVIRTFQLNGLIKPYWDWNRYTRPYVNGYWQRNTFADPGVQRARTEPARVVSRGSSGGGSGFNFVWESDSSGSSFSGGGGRSFSGRSSSRSSFGGGRSSRSHSRSGGSRRF